ncbi:hypothetical protein BJ912DRAFT_847351 [Pholiota molesta]|nr:hypothetical protein BJ912DRAFT_847351 [Pholiota molesta]
MATVTHYIHSHYDPEDREKLERETGQLADEDDPERAWQREASRIARRTAPAPHFVPATMPYGEWSTAKASSSKTTETLTDPFGNSVSGWYRSLTSTKSATVPSTPTTSSNSSSKTLSLPEPVTAPRPKRAESRNKNNWFIMKAIHSEPPRSVSAPAPSLADMLARHPPPLPSEEKYTPPVFLEIGPSNKGFAMLQRSGWNEGEPLGPDVIRRKPADDILPDGDMIPTESSKRKGKMPVSRQRNEATTPPSHQQKMVEVKMENFDGVSELRGVDVIDLTLSDSESDSSEAVESDLESAPDRQLTLPKTASDDSSPYARRALLTPIATVLKSDRLGIGLKAKTVGPHKASRKRVTHNTAALAAHVKAAEESRKRKQLFGRGHRGFERQRKRDEEHRKALLEELKSPW